ncbi:hypothetical protein OsJ_06541 [Oryza sativa Japonica Group]|uniref:Uncharacterized protein n=1 Tax=Oryza sativa subsp. japonica TaxID=39947 RepID=B9F5F9_ORYSJ|nr:hypothetical protein OsJ_06541 [Oryza sativa Japonica Group]
MLTNAILRRDETTLRIKEATLTRTKTDRIVEVIMMMTVENGEIGTTMVEVNDEITMIDDGRSRILQPPVDIINKDADPVVDGIWVTTGVDSDAFQLQDWRQCPHHYPVHLSLPRCSLPQEPLVAAAIGSGRTVCWD